MNGAEKTGNNKVMGTVSPLVIQSHILQMSGLKPEFQVSIIKYGGTSFKEDTMQDHMHAYAKSRVSTLHIFT